MDRNLKILLPVVLLIGVSAYFLLGYAAQQSGFQSAGIPQDIFPFGGLFFLTSSKFTIEAWVYKP